MWAARRVSDGSVAAVRASHLKTAALLGVARPACCYFLQGLCTYGRDCDYAHVKSYRCQRGAGAEPSRVDATGARRRHRDAAAAGTRSAAASAIPTRSC